MGTGDGKKDLEQVLILRDRDLEGNVTGERTIVAHTMEEAFALSSVKRVTFDGHVMKDVLRTEEGLDVKTFCGLAFSVPVGAEGFPERDRYMERSKISVACWKCKDRS